MKCRHFFSFALVLFLSFFFGSFITTNDSFAIDDYVVILDASTMSSVSGSYLCNIDTSVLCSDYDYIIVESVDSSTATVNTRFQLRFRPTNQYLSFIPHVMSRQIYSINDNLQSVNFTNLSNLIAPFSYRITLTNSFPNPSSGNIDITSNGTYDVTNYAMATVDVPAEVIQGDYHDDLVNINKSIIICGAILLVLYFFYCIYRLIIKNSGVH